jgi:hypothetical protein
MTGREVADIIKNNADPRINAFEAWFREKTRSGLTRFERDTLRAFCVYEHEVKRKASEAEEG